jgi:hypothetical protein
VTVTANQVSRDGAPFDLRPDDFVQLVPIPQRGARVLDVAGVRLRATVGWSPLGAGFVSVSVPGSPMVAASSATPASHGKALRGRLPLAVHNHWVVLHDPTGPPEQATVLMLVSGDSSGDQRRSLGLDVAARLPDVLARLRQAAQERGRAPHAPGGGPAAPDPFGPGGAPGQGGPPGGWPQSYPAPQPSAAGAGWNPHAGAAQPPPYAQAGRSEPFGQPGGPDPFAPATPGPGAHGPDPFGAAPPTTPVRREALDQTTTPTPLPDPFGAPPTAGQTSPDQSWPNDPFGPGPGRQ